MKINRTQLGNVLLSMTLEQFQSVPDETEIDHQFSPSFQYNMHRISEKSQHLTWRIWQTPVKRAIFIAILVTATLAMIACATPAIREAVIDFFMVRKETSYSIIFKPDEAATAPSVIENVYIPTFQPEGYTRILKDANNAGASCFWVNEADEYISYTQSVIQKNAANGDWIGINAEETSRITKIINGSLVEIITGKACNQYVAVWTDNRYIYTVDISVSDSDPEQILEALITSIRETE